MPVLIFWKDMNNQVVLTEVFLLLGKLLVHSISFVLHCTVFLVLNEFYYIAMSVLL